MDSQTKPRVWIVGAGPTGLVALRHFKDVADWVWYELKSELGGLWLYQDTTDTTIDSQDMYYQLYGHTHESIYQDLTTIVPKWFFSFKDFPSYFDKQHLGHKDVLEYIQKYSENFELAQFINFNTSVLDIYQNNVDFTQKHWKVTIQQGKDSSSQSCEWFDYIMVCNGHNSIPYIPQKDMTNIDKFKGTIMHAHNLRKLDSEEFLNKNILFVGARWSSMDLLYQFIKNEQSSEAQAFSKIYILEAQNLYLEKSTNFKTLIDEGRIILKQGSSLKFDENTITFDDESIAEIDTVLFCTGYKFRFPFLKNSELIEYDEDDKYYGPLYHRIFWINDPTLMFAGQGDSNALIQVVMEKQILIAKYFIDEKIVLPNEQKMLDDLEQDKTEIKFNGVRYFFKGDVTAQWKYIDKLRELLIKNDVQPSDLNTKFNETLNAMIKIFYLTLKDGNFIDFKTYDYSQCVGEDFEFDTTDYF